MKLTRGQGAFEYMMSYGWAVLVIVVLAVVLWNLGIFTPSSATTFVAIEPVVWSFQGTGAGGSNSIYATNATIAFANIAGIDLTLAVNGTPYANQTIIKFSKPGAALCGWFNNTAQNGVIVRDESGNAVAIVTAGSGGAGPTLLRYGTISLPAGKQVVITGLITGPLGTTDQNYTCGGPSGGGYKYTISYQSALDQSNVHHTDAGTITGTFS